MRQQIRGLILSALFGMTSGVELGCRAPPVYRSKWRIPPIVPSKVAPCVDYRPSKDRVMLLDAGREPRALLRMKPLSGLRMTTHLDSETTLSAEEDGSTPAGTTCYYFKIKSSMPDVFNPLPPDGGLAILADGSFAVRDSRHPRINMVTRTAQRGAMMDTLFPLAPRLPAEPVGIGARWKLSRKDISYGLSSRTHNDEWTYTLLEKNGSSIALQVQWHQETPPQRIHFPNEDDENGHYTNGSIKDEDFILRFDLEKHPLPTRTPVALSATEIMRRNGYAIEKQE